MKIICTNILRAVVALTLPFITIFFMCCDNGDQEGKSTTQLKFEQLAHEWTVVSVMHTTDQTATFKDPDFAINFSGNYKDGSPLGPYNYTVTGNMPIPGPWQSSGTWMFDQTNPETKFVRDDDVVLSYNINGDQLTLTFNCVNCSETNGRTSSIEGEWVFILKSK